MSPPPSIRRILVIGTSGSGKTTLARTLAHQLGVPHVELDALYWGPGWTPAPADILRQRVAGAIAGDAWCICGNYRSVRDLTFDRADTIIWLDYAMPVIAWRIVRRTLRRCLRRETLWNGNRERLTVQLFSRDSLFLWVVNTWRIHRRDYPSLLAAQRRQGKHTLRFHTPAETARWAASISATAESP